MSHESSIPLRLQSSITLPVPTSMASTLSVVASNPKSAGSRNTLSLSSLIGPVCPSETLKMWAPDQPLSISVCDPGASENSTSSPVFHTPSGTSVHISGIPWPTQSPSVSQDDWSPSQTLVPGVTSDNTRASIMSAPA